jgi:DsbC/DsbD-like thiol-disulfide interchange protein
MKNRSSFRLISLALLMGLSIAVGGAAVARAQTTPPKIGTKLVLAAPRVPRGRAVRASLILDIPSGYHVNAHDPVSRFALATKIDVEASSGIKVGAISYPKAIVRKFSFSGDRLGVYENRAVIRFSIMVPPNQPRGNTEIKAHLNYQSCSNEVCFPPMKREVTVSFTVS